MVWLSIKRAESRQTPTKFARICASARAFRHPRYFQPPRISLVVPPCHAPHYFAHLARRAALHSSPANATADSSPPQTPLPSSLLPLRPFKMPKRALPFESPPLECRAASRANASLPKPKPRIRRDYSALKLTRPLRRFRRTVLSPLAAQCKCVSAPPHANLWLLSLKASPRESTHPSTRRANAPF